MKPPAIWPPQRDAAGAPAPAGPAAKEEEDLDEAALAAGALRIKKAFNEKRIVQLFQPIISLVNIESDGVEEFYKVYLQLIDTDGSIVAEEAIYAHATSPVFRKFIDRWLLRETIGRIVGSKRRGKVFILRISEASLADPSLFNWLRKTLTGVDASRPGRSIALEIAAADFAAERRKAAALMTYLRNSHGFRFVLGNIQSADELKSLSGDDGLQMLRIGQELFSRIRANAAEDDGAALFERLRDAGAQLIVDSIRDATTLTEAIAGGASYAMGTFVGEPTTVLDETSRVESFEIA
ncbi:MAG: EAL domain-containing protein [Gammaproteobacteria bacterium]|nr:EAL domain-containing protein [Gammaproteobacteria bacterium]